MPDHKGNITEHASPHDFRTTLDRVGAAIEAAGLTIFARIDHAANAEAAGLQMPPTTVLIYGNAKGGTPVMVATPQAALDLPLRVLVREDAAAKVWVAFHPVRAMLAESGVSELLASRLEPAQQLLIGTALEGGHS